MATSSEARNSSRTVFKLFRLTQLAVCIHLRAETKPAEHRSALTPTTTAALLKAGTKTEAGRQTNSMSRN